MARCTSASTRRRSCSSSAAQCLAQFPLDPFPTLRLLHPRLDLTGLLLQALALRARLPFRFLTEHPGALELLLFHRRQRIDSLLAFAYTGLQGRFQGLQPFFFLAAPVQRIGVGQALRFFQLPLHGLGLCDQGIGPFPLGLGVVPLPLQVLIARPLGTVRGGFHFLLMAVSICDAGFGLPHLGGQALAMCLDLGLGLGAQPLDRGQFVLLHLAQRQDLLVAFAQALLRLGLEPRGSRFGVALETLGLDLGTAPGFF